MNELIKRDEAVKALEQARLYVTGMRAGKTVLAEYSKQVRESFIDILRDLPAADAEMARYGEWVAVGKTSSGTPIRRCNYCNVEKAGRPKSAYCPDCGAKMRRMEYLEGQDHFII